MDLIVQSVMSGLGISEKQRPRETISKIRCGVAKTIRSKQVRFSWEKKMRRICEQLFYPLKFPSIHPEWLIDPNTGKRVEIDLYSYILNLVIECQRYQHYKWVKHFHQTYKEFEFMKERDIFKAAILRRRKIKLLYVPSIKILPDELLEEFLITNIKLSWHSHFFNTIFQSASWSSCPSTPSNSKSIVLVNLLKLMYCFSC